jgi:hypothetical protein
VAATNSRWIAVATYVTAIYLTIPYTSRVWLALSARVRLSPATLSIIILSATAAGVLAVLLRVAGFNIRRLGATLLLAGAYAYLLRTAFVEPIERIHLIEYGVLPGLIWWAMGSRVTARTILMVWLLAADVGVFDELIQHFTPGRFGELRDVVINWESSTLGFMVVAVSKNWSSATIPP